MPLNTTTSSLGHPKALMTQSTSSYETTTTTTTTNPCPFLFLYMHLASSSIWPLSPPAEAEEEANSLCVVPWVSERVFTCSAGAHIASPSAALAQCKGGKGSQNDSTATLHSATEGIPPPRTEAWTLNPWSSLKMVNRKQTRCRNKANRAQVIQTVCLP